MLDPYWVALDTLWEPLGGVFWAASMLSKGSQGSLGGSRVPLWGLVGRLMCIFCNIVDFLVVRREPLGGFLGLSWAVLGGLLGASWGPPAWKDRGLSKCCIAL